jgi:uncharacterized protein (DUF488 family)
VPAVVRTIRTLGHGTLTAPEFLTIARNFGLDVVVDVRRFPGSRRHPHFAQQAMSSWLPEHGIEYRWLVGLGGRRTPIARSPNIGLRNEQFRGYADHMATEEFASGVDELLRISDERAAAVMCSESVWWRCHRRLLADHLVLIEHVAVDHMSHDGRVVAHPRTAEARTCDGHVVYDVVAAPRLFS